MISDLDPALDRSISRRFGTLADDARVSRAAAALEANGISVLRAADAAEANRIVLGLIPDGSEVYHGASQSLEESGITDEIEKSGRYEPFRPRIRNMDRTTQADSHHQPQLPRVRQPRTAALESAQRRARSGNEAGRRSTRAFLGNRVADSRPSSTNGNAGRP